MNTQSLARGFSMGVACLLCAGIGTPANAQDWAVDVAGWTVGRVGNDCIMTMEYGGPGATEVSLLVPEQDASATMISVTNYGWSTDPEAEYPLRFYLGEWVYTQNTHGSRAGARRGFLTSVTPDFLRDFAGSSTLLIMRDDVVVDDLSLAGTAAATARFERCRTELSRDLERARIERERIAHIPADPFAPPPVAPVPPIMTGTPHLLFGPRDYPPEAVRLGQGGAVRLAVDVRSDGSVESCTVSVTSGYEVLDQAACLAIRQRARFSPATNERGRAVAGVFATSVTYSLDTGRPVITLSAADPAADGGATN